MRTLMLGIGDHGATNTPGDNVKTLGLGSCVAVIMLDPKTHTIGMAHVALPDSQISPERAKERPGHFADTAIPSLIKEMERLGCASRGKGLYVKLTGGANVMDPNNTFNIGKRNVLAIRKTLWQFGMGPISEDVGGNISRSVTVDVDNGKVVITSSGTGTWEI